MRNGTKENWVECYQNPVSMGTRCHQAACYVVHDSPFTMLCDAPTNYETEPEYTKFIAQIFNEWEETRVLQGEIGKYIVTARRIGNTWYVGGQTNWDERTITLPLSFLNKEQHYVVTLLTDGINANHNAEDYLLDTQSHHNGETLSIRMANGGGFVLKFGKHTIVDHF
jgi:alpha-glucosidase